MLLHIITEGLSPHYRLQKSFLGQKQRGGCYFWAYPSVFQSGTWSLSIWWKRTGQAGARGGADGAPHCQIMNDSLIFFFFLYSFGDKKLNSKKLHFQPLLTLLLWFHSLHSLSSVPLGVFFFHKTVKHNGKRTIAPAVSYYWLWLKLFTRLLTGTMEKSEKEKGGGHDFFTFIPEKLRKHSS